MSTFRKGVAMPSVKYITPELILSWGPCDKYGRAAITKLFGRRKRATVEDILRAPVPVEDAFWVVLREELISAKALRLFAVACANRALQRERKAGREPDQRLWDAVKTSRRYAMGKASVEELSAAWDAARAVARDAAMAAAWAVAWAAARDAAWDVARDAAMAAARDAEYKWQKGILLRLLGRSYK